MLNNKLITYFFTSRYIFVGIPTLSVMKLKFHMKKLILYLAYGKNTANVTMEKHKALGYLFK